MKLPCYYTGPHVKANTEFVGRLDIIDKIDDVFQPGVPATDQDSLGATTFTILGLSGIGKTQIAAQYMFLRKEEYDAIFWLQADSTVKLDGDFKQIAIRLELETQELSTDSNLSRDLVQGWLARPLKPMTPAISSSKTPGPVMARWLMIFDNVDQSSILDDYFPKHGQGNVLITSKDPRIRGAYVHRAMVTLPPLSVTEAVCLFRKMMKFQDHQGSDQLMTEIVRKLHCFPLAILHMAGIIRSQRLSLPGFLKLYDEDCSRQEFYSDDSGLEAESIHGYSKRLTSLWSHDTLEKGPFSILSVIAFLDPETIQEDIFLTDIKNIPLHGFPSSPIDYRSALNHLIELSIVTVHVDRTELSTHRTVQDVIRTQLHDNIMHVKEVFKATVHMLSSVWPYAVPTVDGSYQLHGRRTRWDQCPGILPHIGSLRHYFEGAEHKHKFATLKFATLIMEAG